MHFPPICGILYLSHYCYHIIKGVLCPVVLHISTFGGDACSVFVCGMTTKITIVWQQFRAIAFLQVRSSSWLRIFGNKHYITDESHDIKMDSRCRYSYNEYNYKNSSIGNQRFAPCVSDNYIIISRLIYHNDDAAAV